MRLLRPTGAPLLASLWLVVSLGCPASDDTTNPFDMTTGPQTTMTTMTTTTTGMSSTTSDDTTTTSDDTTTGLDSGTATDASGSSDDGPTGQACGNGVIEGTEQCDCGEDFCTPAGLGGNMCLGQTALLPNGKIRYYTGGILNCNMASCQFDFAQCSFCGDTLINGQEICELDSDPGPSCQALGMGSSTMPLPCNVNCLEWDTTCCEVPLPKECQ
ncbi:hypothetical protein [Paraliomyxa miuraensis]|uniref:hypothetical protein n=1 Tax=Paraliomyxa miuraensis TaxID=376150 RepID=UPI00225B3932|nr:hypothetical protein [Paraliomyxa miuraensis]MCX4239903.1 hypothetical protein [Paraliomyxa miuraensis]